MSSYWKMGALALGVSLLFAGPVYAEENSEATETAEAASDNDDMICRRLRTTGTRMTQRICMTRAEWSSEREEAQEQIREHNQQGSANPTSGD